MSENTTNVEVKDAEVVSEKEVKSLFQKVKEFGKKNEKTIKKVGIIVVGISTTCGLGYLAYKSHKKPEEVVAEVLTEASEVAETIAA